jgi:hypothetical protein
MSEAIKNLPTTLDGLAKEIRSTLDRADKSQRHADDLRITAGRMLLAAREQVQAQKLVWSEWLAANVPDRSERDVRRLLAVAKAPDPAAAADQERRATREQVAATRQRQADIRMSAADFDPMDHEVSPELVPAKGEDDLVQPSCRVIYLPPATPEMVEKLADQHLYAFEFVGKLVITRWWATASADARRQLVDLIEELATAPEAAVVEAIEPEAEPATEPAGKDIFEPLHNEDDPAEIIVIAAEIAEKFEAISSDGAANWILQKLAADPDFCLPPSAIDGHRDEASKRFWTQYSHETSLIKAAVRARIGA